MSIRASQRIVMTVLVIALCIMTGRSVLAQTPSPTVTAREQVIADIQEYAHQQVELDLPTNTGEAVAVFRDNEAGLTAVEIARIYNEAYSAAKNAKQGNWLDQLLRQIFDWKTLLIALLGILAANSNERVKKWTSSLWDVASNSIYNKLAGARPFRRWALKKYRSNVIEAYSKIRIPFRPKRPLDMSNIYVPVRMTGSAENKQVDASYALARHKRLMVIGTPGAGKSIFLRSLALAYAQERLGNIPNHPVTIMLELHRFSGSDQSVMDQVVAAFARHGFPKAERFVTQNLKQGTLLLLLDGLDEVATENRQVVVQRIKDFLHENGRCRVVITCRTAVYRGEFGDVADQTLEIDEFSDEQILRFLAAWGPELPANRSVEELMEKLYDNPRILSLVRNPLLLTIVAYLYADSPNTFTLPRSRAEFYERSTDVLLSQWQQERNSYEARDKKSILQHLALVFQHNSVSDQQDRRAVDFKTVLEQVQDVLPKLNMPAQEGPRPIVDEIVYRSGLLLSIDGGAAYTFAHLTLQEYFAAAALLNDEQGILSRFQRDHDAWRETIRLWCGLSPDSTNVVRAIYATDPVIALECLADSQKIEEDLAQEIITHFKEKVQAGDLPQPDAVLRAFGAVASDGRPRGKELFDFLTELLKSMNDTARANGAGALAATNLRRAAEVLTEHYENTPYIRAALRQLGNLAVEPLLDLAYEGIGTALDDLALIRTEKAALALGHFVWQAVSVPRDARRQGIIIRDRLVVRAAWHLAGMLDQLIDRPGTHSHLALPLWEIEATRPDIMKWVWQPFTTAGDFGSRFPQTIGKIAELISRSPEDFVPPPDVHVDPRIAIPLLLMSRSRLQLAPSNSNIDEHLHIDTDFAEQLAEILDRAYKWLQTFEDANPNSRIRVTDNLGLFRYIEQLTPSQLERSDATDAIKNRHRLGSVVNIFSRELAVDQWQQFQKEVAGLFLISWRTTLLQSQLFSGLPSVLQLYLIQLVLSDSGPTQEDWKNLGQKKPQTLRRFLGIRYLALRAIIWLLSVMGALSYIWVWRISGQWYLLLLAILILASFIPVLDRVPFQARGTLWHSSLRDSVTGRNLLNLFKAYSSLRAGTGDTGTIHTLRSRIVYSMLELAWLPSVVIGCTLVLQYYLEWSSIILIWVCTFLVVVVVESKLRKYERALLNPLDDLRPYLLNPHQD